MLFQFIIQDIKEPLSFLPIALALALLFLFLQIGLKRLICHYKGVKSAIPWKQTRVEFILLTYFVVLLWISFFSRPAGSRNRLDLELFSTWGSSAYSQRYFIENILMTIPFGLLVPIRFIRFRGPMRICMLTFCMSILLEITQYVTSRGYCQLDDVITNTSGALVGYGIYYILCIVPKKRNVF